MRDRFSQIGSEQIEERGAKEEEEEGDEEEIEGK